MGLSIIQNKEIWLRNALAMNDFTEIEHGLECLAASYKGAAGQRLRTIIDAVYPGLSDKLTPAFDARIHSFKADTFMICLSEHLPEEDNVGRLSMWRAYGGRNGVAVVLNPSPFLGVNDELKAYSSPVAYHTVETFNREFELVVDNIEKHAGILAALGEEGLFKTLFIMFRFAILCTKHVGFREEREWRVVYTPSYEGSDYIIPEIRSINGEPQVIQKLTFENARKAGLHQATVAELVEAIIIGPSNNSYIMWDAFVKALEAEGVADAYLKVRRSEIPLKV